MGKDSDEDVPGSNWQTHSGTASSTLSNWMETPFVWDLQAAVRQDFDDEQDDHPADWIELFYDLFIVAFCVNLSTMLAHSDLGFRAILLALLYVTSFNKAWSLMALLRSTFIFQGSLFYCVMAVNTIGLAGAAAELDVKFSFRSSFILWRLVVYASQVIILLVTMWQLTRAFRYTQYLLLTMAISIALHVIVLFFPVSKDDSDLEQERRTICEVLVWIALVVENSAYHTLWLSKRIRSVIRPVPLNVHHSMERHQIFIMILLGESVIAIATMTSNKHELRLRLCGVLASIVCFCMGVLYFHAQPHSPHSHALARSIEGASVFLHLSFALACSILLFGSAVKCVLITLPLKTEEHHRRLASSSDEVYPSHEASLRFLVISYSASVTCIVCSRYLHRPPILGCKRFRRFVFRPARMLVVWLPVVVILISRDTLAVVGTLTVDALVLVLFDVFANIYFTSDTSKSIDVSTEEGRPVDGLKKQKSAAAIKALIRKECSSRFGNDH